MFGDVAILSARLYSARLDRPTVVHFRLTQTAPDDPAGRSQKVYIKVLGWRDDKQHLLRGSLKVFFSVSYSPLAGRPTSRFLITYLCNYSSVSAGVAGIRRR